MVLAIVLIICVIVAGPFAIIYLAFKSHREQDLILKNKIKREAWWCLLGWVLLSVSFIFYLFY